MISQKKIISIYFLYASFDTISSKLTFFERSIKKAEILTERDVERERERERDIKKISRVFFFAAFLARRQNCQQDAGSPFTVTMFDILRMYK